MSLLVKSLQQLIGASDMKKAEQANLKKLLEESVHGTIPEGIDTVEGIIKKLQDSQHQEEEDEGAYLKTALDTYIKTATDKPDLKKYYYNSMANIQIKNDKLGEEIGKHKLEIDYKLNDIFIKDNTIDILKLIITGALLSLLTLALNKYIIIDLPVINIISVIISIFLFIIIIRVIINRQKKPLNFRQFNYARNPDEGGFWNELSSLLLNAIPIPSFKSRSSTDGPHDFLPHGTAPL